MYRYIRSLNEGDSPQVLVVQHDHETYFPVFHHTAVDQDRPVGKKDTFCEHVHDLYHAVLYTHATGFYSRCGRKQIALPGTFVIVSPGEPHDFVTARGNSVYSEITFSFESPRKRSLTLPFEKILTHYTGADLQFIPEVLLSGDVADELLILMIQVTDYLKSRAKLSSYYANRTLARIFEILVAHCCVETPAAQHAVLDDRIARVRQYIEEHFSEPIGIDDLTSMIHMSTRQLFRMFTRTFRISPLAYQQNLRLETARTLLRSTPLRCNEIARRVGYANVYYFHRLFKKKTGLTPRRYRLSMMHEV
ncbi:MAG: helix-turn-helix transcriptional regulator [Sedimentisphaerales bacterium]|nr:helix-turn-helix transcriptional regulator [Sedimentisphaerales bacterium]